MWSQSCITQLCGLHAACGLDTHVLGIKLAFSNRTNQDCAMDHSLNLFHNLTIHFFKTVFSSTFLHTAHPVACNLTQTFGYFGISYNTAQYNISVVHHVQTFGYFGISYNTAQYNIYQWWIMYKRLVTLEYPTTPHNTIYINGGSRTNVWLLWNILQHRTIQYISMVDHVQTFGYFGISYNTAQYNIYQWWITYKRLVALEYPTTLHNTIYINGGSRTDVWLLWNILQHRTIQYISMVDHVIR